MPIEFKDVWDFHTDLRFLADLSDEDAHLLEQIDIPTAAKLGGVFSALGRLADAPQEAQFEALERDLELIRGSEGLSVVLSRKDLEGVGAVDTRGRRLFHRERK